MYLISSLIGLNIFASSFWVLGEAAITVSKLCWRMYVAVEYFVFEIEVAFIISFIWLHQIHFNQWADRCVFSMNLKTAENPPSLLPSPILTQNLLFGSVTATFSSGVETNQAGTKPRLPLDAPFWIQPRQSPETVFTAVRQCSVSNNHIITYLLLNQVTARYRERITHVNFDTTLAKVEWLGR